MSAINFLNKFGPFFISKTALKTSSYLCTKAPQSQNVDETAAKKKPKTEKIPRITLMLRDNMSITTLEEAQKISKRRDLKLVKIIDLDSKTQRPVYKLMSGNEYHAEDLKQRENKKKEKQNSDFLKGEKVIILSSNITEHDLKTHINKISKWIAKRYEVRVVINGDSTNMTKAENIYSFLDSGVKDVGRILQKRQKNNDIRFQIVPPSRKDEKEITS